MKKKIIAALQLGSSSQGKAITLDRILSCKERIQQLNCDLLVILPSGVLIIPTLRESSCLNHLPCRIM